MSAIDKLLDEIFDSQRPDFYAEFAAWVRDSRRYRDFASHNSTKIRAKLRNAHADGGIEDLRAELETAALLLRESSFSLEYERYAALKQRGPDFTVTFKTHTPFNIEVRRVRALEIEDGDHDMRIKLLMTVLCDKVRQMPPSFVNLLWLVAEDDLTEDDLNQAALTLRQLAEAKNEAYFTRRRFKNAADFLKHNGQLSGIVLHHAAGNAIWLNPLARHKTPPDIVRAIQRLAAS